MACSAALGVDFRKRSTHRRLASIAAVIGIPLGVVLGFSEQVYRSLEFVIDFFRSTPASAMFPLFLVLFGVGDNQDLRRGLRRRAGDPLQCRLRRDERAQDPPARRQSDGRLALRVLLDVMLLESLPQTFVGLRNGVSLALVIIVVAEMFIGSRTGSASACSRRSSSSTCRDMYAAIFAAGALGYGLNLMFLMIERRFVHWSGK